MAGWEVRSLWGPSVMEVGVRVVVGVGVDFLAGIVAVVAEVAEMVAVEGVVAVGDVRGKGCV